MRFSMRFGTGRSPTGRMFKRRKRSRMRTKTGEAMTVEIRVWISTGRSTMTEGQAIKKLQEMAKDGLLTTVK